MAEKRSDFWSRFAYELRDMLAGAAFPLMLSLVLSVTFIGMTLQITVEDKPLAIVLLVIGEVLMAVALVIFGRQSGITSVRKLVQHAKKREIGREDKQTLYCTGEYSAYKGFVMGLISCVPFILIQFIECLAHNSFCEFMLVYVFGWAVFPFRYADLSPWFNFISVFFPVAVHGLAYIIGAHREWNKQQKVAALQKKADKGSGKEEE